MLLKDEAIVSVVIPATVVTIGDSAFKGTAIVTIVIPESVTSIGGGAFSEIPTLTEVVFARDKDAEGGVTELGEGVFDGSNAIETIIVPDGSGSTYTEKITESSPGVTVGVTETQPTPFTITVNAGNGGTITTNPTGSALAGTTVRFNANPNQSYILANLSVIGANGNTIQHEPVTDATIDPNGGTTTTGNTYYTFTMPDSNVTITATFTQSGTQPETYNIVTNVIGGSSTGIAPGTITTNPTGSAAAGTTVKIFASPNQGYTLASVSVIGANGNTIQHELVTDVITDPNGGTTTTGNTYYTFTMPDSNVTVTAEFSSE